MHLNLTYLLEVDENEALRVKEDENSGVKWVNIEDVEKVSTEKWVVENVYKKINEKLKKLVRYELMIWKITYKYM